MSYGPIANQRTKCSTSVKTASGEYKSLPRGSYIKAIRKEYMPQYHPFDGFDDSIYTAAYTQLGLVLITSVDIEWNVY
jgi:hypothetical protein